MHLSFIGLMSLVKRIASKIETIGLASMFMLLCGCGNSNSYYLKPITVKDFAKFVQQTGYITDAEKFGWSIVQHNVFDFKVVDGATWRMPNGIDTAKADFPVAQVSYNDAIAYCNWADTRLPHYEEYWELVKNDDRKIMFNINTFAKAQEANLVGNYWDITSSDNPDKVRLAGGSIFCNTTTCNGTSKDRELFVDALTGNVHISFAVVEKEK